MSTLLAIQQQKEYSRAHYLAHREEVLRKSLAYHHAHKEARNQARKAHYIANQETEKEARSQRSRAWYSVNKERGRENNRQWKRNNPEKLREWRMKPQNHFARNLRRRALRALKNSQKSGTMLELLGCTIPELRTHLEAQFRPGMTWENYGPVWHIDHKRPCVSFDLTDPAQQRVCFHHNNLQPLFAEENLKKGDKYRA